MQDNLLEVEYPMTKKTILAALAMTALLAATPARAMEKPVLNIYTYDSFTAKWGPGPAVEKAFENICGCDVKFTALADGVSILNRLKLEGRNTKADIVLGLDTNVSNEAKATGLLAPHETDLKNLHVPVEWKDDVFVPYDWAHFAVIYNSEKLKTPPKSLKALVEGPAEERIVIQDPRTSTPGLGLLLWIKAVYGDRAGDAWKKLSRRVLTVTPGWSAAYGLFTKGEAPMVFSYVTSPAYHMIEEKTDKYRAAAFSEGHYLQIELAARLKTSKHPGLARRFLAFMLTPAFQDNIPEKNWMFPAGKTSRPLPEAFGKLVKPARTLLLPPEEVAKRRKAWIAEWLRAMSG